MAKLIELTTTEQQLFAFVVILNSVSQIEDSADLIGPTSSRDLPGLLATILGLCQKQVKVALSSSSALIRSGLIKLTKGDKYPLSRRFDLLCEQLPDAMMDDLDDPLLLLKDLMQKAPTAELTLSDYPHLKPQISLLRQYLDTVVTQQRTGVNILLYGPPGTGKTQLVRLLAQLHKTPLFEVSCEDADGDPIGGMTRLRAYRAAQSFLAKTRNLLLLDEIEDLFSYNPFSSAKDKQHKGWLNKMLEHNPVPTFGLSNDIGMLDNAYIRRFDMVLELPVPPLQQRAKLLQKAADGLLDAESVNQLAAHPHLSPAVIQRTAKVVSSLATQKPNKKAKQRHFIDLVSSTLKAQGYKEPDQRSPTQPSSLYDPQFTNADQDLIRLTEGLGKSKQGRLCLYGPPGTGKTAFAHYVATTLAKPLLIKRASDLMGAYVGESEKAVAAAFAEANSNQSVLLIDEADSFLQERRHAVRSWEVTLVNEMLTQMEQFNGLFIASTNLIDNLDKAAPRRFDLKALFGYLRPEQTRSLFNRYCQQLKLKPDQRLHSKLNQLTNLTPGDFTAVARQHLFYPLADAHSFYLALAEEVKLKTETLSKPMGFVY